MDDDAVAQQGVLDDGSRTDMTAAADAAVAPDDRIGGKDGPGADDGAGRDDRARLDDDALLQLGRGIDEGRRRDAVPAGEGGRFRRVGEQQPPDLGKGPLGGFAHENRDTGRHQAGEVRRAQDGGGLQAFEQAGVAPTLDEDQRFGAAIARGSDGRHFHPGMRRIGELRAGHRRYLPGRHPSRRGKKHWIRHSSIQCPASNTPGAPDSL